MRVSGYKTQKIYQKIALPLILVFGFLVVRQPLPANILRQKKPT